MPVEPTTFFFEEYFETPNALSSFEPSWLNPPVLANAGSDHSHRVVLGGGPGGEGCWEFTPPTSVCPGCDDVFDECGTPGSSCDFGVGLVRFRDDEGSDWYHVRSYLKPEGSIEALDGYPPVADMANWMFDQSWTAPGGWQQHVHGAISMLMPSESGYVGSGSIPGPYGPNGELLSYRPAVRLEIGGYYLGSEPAVRIWVPGSTFLLTDAHGFPFNGSGRPVPVHRRDWHCFELAVGEVSPATSSGRVKLWINGVLCLDGTFSSLANYGPGLGAPIGFALGSFSIYGGLGFPSVEHPYNGTLFWHAGLQERHADRRWGLKCSWARVAAADGPIGCHTRGGTPPEETPDPDAEVCVGADDYANANLLRGECGRSICSTRGKTRESWETVGAGFPSSKSFWYRWVAPRSGRFLWRTRGSEVFNEISVHRHTGSTPPPLVAMSNGDPWEPEPTNGAAVEIDAVAGTEYRIRVASSSDGWIVIDFGPPLPVISDDGWTINESERETRSRVSVVGTVTGLAVEDDQVAAAANGAGAQRTLDGVIWGDV